MSSRKLFDKEPELLDRMTELYGSTAENTAVLLYFDKVCPFLTKMDNAEAGELFGVLVGYALTGHVPKIFGPRAEIAFDVIRPSIDRKQREYRENHARGVVHGKYMTYCREQKGRARLTEEEYARLLLAGEEIPAVTDKEPAVSGREPDESDREPVVSGSSNNHNQPQNQNQKQKQNQKQEQKQKQERKQNVFPAGACGREKRPDRPDPSRESSAYRPPSAEEFEALRRKAVRRLTEHLQRPG